MWSLNPVAADQYSCARELVLAFAARYLRFAVHACAACRFRRTLPFVLARSEDGRILGRREMSDIETAKWTKKDIDQVAVSKAQMDAPQDLSAHA